MVLRDATVDGSHVRIITAPATLRTGRGAVQVARSLDEVYGTLRSLALLLGLFSLLGIAAAAFAGRAVASAGLGPVRRVTAAAEHVAATRDLRAAIPVSGDDEVARLARSVNAMLAALESARLQQRRLVEDAGHELRTPLTSLRANVELLARAEERGPQALPAADRKAMLADLGEQAVELTTLVNELVALAREDAGQEAPRHLRLDELVGRCVARAKRHAPDATISVEAEPLLVQGRQTGLIRAVNNLIDNAVKFSAPAPAVLQVCVRRAETDPRLAEVAVADRGRGIDPADRERVFERFYRATEARAVPGSGLGLAIVAQVAAEHGGSASLEPRIGGGTVARLRLRLPEPASGAGPAGPGGAEVLDLA
nr:HAMP domain-containing sensor histidine kinase [Motilibacter deserti]